MTAKIMDEMRTAGLLKGEARLTPKGRDWLRALQDLSAGEPDAGGHDDPVEAFDTYGVDDLTNPAVEPFDAEDFVSSTSGLFR